MDTADRRYRHVVFDVDGTLVDTECANLVSLQRLMLELTGRRYDLDDLRFSLGIPGVDALRRLGADHSDAVYRRWEQLEAMESGSSRPFPGMVDTIRELRRRGVHAGVVSSRARGEYAQQISPFGMDALFDQIILVEDTRRHKPDPDPLLEYLRRTGAARGEALYVGDSEYDLRCATAAGVDFALASWGAQHPYGGEKYVLSQPSDLLGIAPLPTR